MTSGCSFDHELEKKEKNTEVIVLHYIEMFISGTSVYDLHKDLHCKVIFPLIWANMQRNVERYVMYRQRYDAL